MNENTLAKRYATALAELAAEQNVVDSIGEELNAFLALLGEAPDLRNALTDPTVSQASQMAALNAILEKAQPADTTGNFLRILVEKRRMPLIDAIVEAYNQRVEAQSGRLTVQVSASKALTQTHVNQLETVFKEKTGQEIRLEVEEKPELLGGLVIQVGSLMIDASVRNQLSRLKESMRG